MQPPFLYGSSSFLKAKQAALFNSSYRSSGQHPSPSYCFGILPLVFVGGAFLNVVQRRFQNVQPELPLQNSPQKISRQTPPNTPSLLSLFFKCHRLPYGPPVGPPFG